MVDMAVSRISGTVAGLYKQTESLIPDNVKMPLQWLHIYEDFISKNASSVSQIESVLRSLTYIIPGRFRESEITSESLHSGLQLLSLYHDSLLAKATSPHVPPSTQRPLPTPHNRYTKFWITKSPLYKQVALVLQTIQYTELLWEMVCKRRSGKARWRVVVLLEMIKALCRLLLVRSTNFRPLVSRPLPEREREVPILDGQQSGRERWDGMETPHATDTNAGANWTMPRTGLSLPTLPNSSEIVEYLLQKALTPDDIKVPKNLLRRVATRPGQLAEMMWILRPVVYALAMQHWQRDRKRWAPWLVGISIEVTAQQLSKRDRADGLPGGLKGLTGLERGELKHRGWCLGWWIMRGAFYENVNKRLIGALAGSLRHKLFLDTVGGIIEDYDYLWSEYYFSNALT